jgi:hypothetical protein
MQTVVETPAYLKAAAPLFTEAERADIVGAIASDPEAGDIMPNTGGYRKRRFGRAGTGKRGGARVVAEESWKCILDGCSGLAVAEDQVRFAGNFQV